MEYRIVTQSEGGNGSTNPFTKVTDTNMTFAVGTYEVRYGAKKNYDASLILSLYDETLSLRKNVEKMKNNGIMIKKDKLDSIIKKNRERQQHTIVEWENADNLHMDNDEPDLTALNELHDSIMQAYKSDKSYPASSFSGNPSTNAMLDLTLQKIIAEYNSQIVKSDNSSEEPITFDTLNFTGHYKSPFF